MFAHPNPLCRALLVMICFALAPWSAHGQLVQLDSYIPGQFPNADPTGPPVITALPGSRLVTAQLQDGVFQDILTVRLWRVGRGGEITALDTDTLNTNPGWVVEDVTPLGTNAFVVAVRPSPDKFKMLVWDVSSGGALLPRPLGATFTGTTGPVRLAELSSSRVFLLAEDDPTGEATLHWWETTGGTETLAPLQDLGDAAEYDIAVHGGSEVAVVLRNTILNGDNLRLFRASNNAAGFLSNPRFATGNPVDEVDVAFTATGAAITLSRDSLGQTTVTRWADVTLWPSTVKILMAVSSATATPSLENLRIEPLKTDWVATAGIDSGGTLWLRSWDVGGAVAPLTSITSAPADALDFVRLYSHRLATVNRIFGAKQRLITWGELSP
jgi:hypothetical protein